MDHRDTIFAPATGQGLSGVAIIRVSGPGASLALQAICGLSSLEPRRSIRCRMVDPETGDLLDKGLALWFPGPNSFTGEDVAELHIHGGRATLGAVCSALGGLRDPVSRGFRFADPGEFSRRALENGKMDLSEIEALSDLVQAETEAQRRQALRQMEGALGDRIEEIRVGLLNTLARLEAAIDFPDEDLPDDLFAEIDRNILEVKGTVAQYIAGSERGERIREGLRVAIVGAPNVGKSSLLNALAGRDAAIVSERAGTTRDVVEVRLDLGGFAVTVADTAGLRESEDSIEREGVRRAEVVARSADLRLVVYDGSTGLDGAARAFLGADSITVCNKIDLGCEGVPGEDAVFVSARTGQNVDALIGVLTARVSELLGGAGGVPLTRERHRIALQLCLEGLDRAGATDSVDLKAEDLRLAVSALGRITGRVDVEDVLDVIFSEFCIGK
jgi:tRNA modification GTPase